MSVHFEIKYLKLLFIMASVVVLIFFVDIHTYIYVDYDQVIRIFSNQNA